MASLPHGMEGSERQHRWGWLMAIALLLTAAMPYFEGFMNANERPRLLQGIAVLDEGSWAIDGPVTATIPAGIDISHSKEGRVVPNKPPGTTIVTALAWAMGGPEGDSLRAYTQRSRLLGGVLPTLLICMVALGRGRGGAAGPATTAAVVLYVLATPVSSYARLLYGHQLTACLLFLGTILIVDAPLGHDRHSGVRRALLGGFLCAGAVVSDYLAVFAAVPMAAFLAVDLRNARDDGSRRAGAAFVGAVIPMTLLAVYHTEVFGRPWSTGYHHAAHEPFAAIHARGLLGLVGPNLQAVHEHLVSPWGGVLPWAPLVVVGGLGLVGRVRASPDPEARLFLALLVTFVVVNLCLEQTGGWRVGPRYLVVAFPFAIPGLAWVFAQVSKRPLMLGSMLVVVGWSVAVNTLAALLFPHLIPHGHPLSDLLGPLLRAGVLAHGWAAWVASALGFAFGGTWVLLGASVMMVAIASLRVAADQAGRLAGLLGLFLGLVLGLGVLAAPQDPAASSDSAAILRIWEPEAGQPTPPSRWIPRPGSVPE